MTKPLVSVLMPVKNGEKFLIPCLESIINQSMTAWELICIDDGCTDTSLSIIDRKADPRIRTIKNQGEGIADALSTAFELVKGDFVTRMDCDDVMHEKKLELMANHLSGMKGEKSVVTNLVKYFSDNKLGNGYREYEAWLNDLLLRGKVFDEIYRECTIPSPSWMARREDLEKHSVLENLGIPEDYEMCFRLYAQEFTIDVVPEILHFWRDHDDRITRNDERYDIRSFAKFKLKKFLELELNKDDDFVLWGAGGKGKEMAKILIEGQIEFSWITDNEKKQGLSIYEKPLESPVILQNLKQPKVIVAVSNKKEQRSIKEFLEREGDNTQLKYFLFF